MKVVDKTKDGELVSEEFKPLDVQVRRFRRLEIAKTIKKRKQVNR